jgi:anti-sigma factor RsiW
MPDLDRIVAGLRCRDVLAMLADYVDGDLRAADVARVDTHLRACDRCVKFGGEYAALVEALRGRLAHEAAMSSESKARVRGRLAAELARDEA